MASKLFIIGSGFTNAATNGASPLNKDLLQSIHSIEPIIWDDLKARYSTKDIEIALTKLDLDISAAPDESELINLRKLRKKAEKSLSDFFSQFRYSKTMLQKSPWLEEFIQGAFAKGDVAVSLNYDCFLEGLLDRFDLWSPNEGYGEDRIASIVFSEYNPSPVRVLKIHGSENFHRNPAIGSHSDKNRSLDYSVDESIFPVSGKNVHFCLPVRKSEDAIIAPSFVKIFQYPFISLMLQALEAAFQAETLVVIGCGLRPEDGFLSLLLWRFVRKGRRIVIIDPCASDIRDRILCRLEYDLSRIMHPIDKSLKDGWADLIKELEKRK